TLRGWADRLGETMASVDDDFEFINLARRGLKTEEVRRQQLGAALELKPDLASALVGMNDLLEPNFDAARYERDLDSIVGPLREGGAVVLTATYPDITMFSPLPGRFLKSVRGRLQAASEAVRRISARHGTLMLDADELPEAKERVIVSVDRLHPSPKGHVLVAQLFARKLEEHSGVPVPQPEDGDVAGKLAQFRWLVRQFSPSEVGRFIYRFYLSPRRGPTSS
ncbi:MAG TPA: SGNH/GDSL hydrolase family protein, partial [Actinomycetota bacterium]|nr:SGNH/GDSL hydrolase family protein [Actinomycetota bacterium]